ncbi:histidine phosphatase family protein [Halomonas saccharevitans]|uniref:Histidine phosphatase family protein n=1 Tax=Halomonas saccharevitans TaxID=416872 RepID=A0ABU3NCX3_9GAMM|nr:histidine phosphatase family protein [Halomonas saccharevitans]MDT8878378.1 histidine phosphatase family protein [Halomonas saccharevitans]
MSNTFPPVDGTWRNHYLLMRHGHSQANQEGRIISSPALGLTGFGLSPRGCTQLDTLLADWRWARPQRILHSDFLRTAETAERVAAHFDLTLTLEPRLRERHFGEFEGQSDDRYAEVWARDAKDPTHRQGGVEAVSEVAARMRAVIDELERHYHDETILLVSHGDPLQILLTALEGRELSLHREREPLAPASITSL